MWKVLAKYGVPQVMINLLRSLHEGMVGQVMVGGERTPQISVNNGLRQGCTLAPTLFNLFFNLVIEQWREQCQALGVEVLYKCSGRLVGARTRSPAQTIVSELLFADDACAITTSRADMEQAVEVLLRVTSQWGLTVSVPKTKLMVVGEGLQEDDVTPISTDSGVIDVVSDFKYLGALVSSSGGIEGEARERIGHSSRVFGMLRKAVFQDSDLSVSSKMLVYMSVVLGVLLYGSETWAIKSRTMHKLEAFHNRCMQCILGITSEQQIQERITTVQLRRRFGLNCSLEGIISKRRLRWLGHVARMSEERIPKQLLFGWLPKTRPTHRPWLRWRDKVRQDLRNCQITEGAWYQLAQERDHWRTQSQGGIQVFITKQEKRHQERHALRHHLLTTTNSHLCQTCGRSFLSSAGYKNHRCVKQARPTALERNAFHQSCLQCQRKFRRPQDLSRHKCGLGT